jgi:hypothetical protein
MRHQVTLSVTQLRPTQITVAMARVAQARAQIRGAVLGGQLHDFQYFHPLIPPLTTKARRLEEHRQDEDRCALPMFHVCRAMFRNYRVAVLEG